MCVRLSMHEKKGMCTYIHLTYFWHVHTYTSLLFQNPRR